MIKKKMENALNRQLNRELYSAYLYLSMSAYFDSLNLKGFAQWMKVQVQEEMTHVMKFYDYIIRRSGKVILSFIEDPPFSWSSPLGAFEHAYKHEQGVTGLINDLVEVSHSEHDHATDNFLLWFISEQVEEEDNASTVVGKIKLMGDAPGGLFLLDQELGKRVFVPPTQAGQN